jgi:protein-arginine kinase activator protein McsA
MAHKISVKIQNYFKKLVWIIQGKDARLRHCKRCGDWFQRTTFDRKFCSIECRTKFAQKKYRDGLK